MAKIIKEIINTNVLSPTKPLAKVLKCVKKLKEDIASINVSLKNRRKKMPITLSHGWEKWLN